MTLLLLPRPRLPAEVAVVDVADHDRAAGERAGEAAGEFQGHAGVQRRGDGVAVELAGRLRHVAGGERDARRGDDLAASLEREQHRHLHALARRSVLHAAAQSRRRTKLGPVIAGLGPAIHLLRKLLRRGWMRGSSPRMTKVLFGTAPALQRTAMRCAASGERKTSHAYFFFTS